MIIGEGDFAKLVLEVIKRLDQMIEARQLKKDINHEVDQIGLQNVYDKFLELENRQKDIEDLLNSDELLSVIKSIPKIDNIHELMKKIEDSEIGRLNKYLNSIKDDLDRLMEIFKR
jgi:hypothetical protein